MHGHDVALRFALSGGRGCSQDASEGHLKRQRVADSPSNNAGHGQKGFSRAFAPDPLPRMRTYMHIHVRCGGESCHLTKVHGRNRLVLLASAWLPRHPRIPRRAQLAAQPRHLASWRAPLQSMPSLLRPALSTRTCPLPPPLPRGRPASWARACACRAEGRAF